MGTVAVAASFAVGAGAGGGIVSLLEREGLVFAGLFGLDGREGDGFGDYVREEFEVVLAGDCVC